MSWIHTYSGGRFHIADPEKSDFAVEDIAHALSNICRFGGHCRHFYSVAEHSILVSKIIKEMGGSPLEQLWGLMHDATEAYMGDIPTPLKATLVGFEAREHALMRVIAARLDLPLHGEASLLPKIVKVVDRIALVTEARQLTRGTADWGPEYHKVKSHPTPLIAGVRPDIVRSNFLALYHDLVYLVEETADRNRKSKETQNV